MSRLILSDSGNLSGVEQAEAARAEECISSTHVVEAVVLGGEANPNEVRGTQLRCRSEAPNVRAVRSSPRAELGGSTSVGSTSEGSTSVGSTSVLFGAAGEGSALKDASAFSDTSPLALRSSAQRRSVAKSALGHDHDPSATTASVAPVSRSGYRAPPPRISEWAEFACCFSRTGCDHLNAQVQVAARRGLVCIALSVGAVGTPPRGNTAHGVGELARPADSRMPRVPRLAVQIPCRSLICMPSTGLDASS